MCVAVVDFSPDQVISERAGYFSFGGFRQISPVDTRLLLVFISLLARGDSMSFIRRRIESRFDESERLDYQLVCQLEEGRCPDCLRYKTETYKVEIAVRYRFLVTARQNCGELVG